MASFGDRFIGALKLDARAYEDVEADPNALGQAIVVVAVSAVCAAIGSAGLFGTSGMISALLASLVGWVVWSGVTFLIGTKVLPMPQTRADLGQLLRTTGFAAAPGVIRILGVVPFLGWITSFVAFVWMLAAFVVAVRQALDYDSTPRAVGVCLIGWVAYLIIAWLLHGLVRL
ncbi:MAG: YIP1 family protein [Bryobacterales bacterium]|nr:YIP1 family protein [Bryobacterales bacterium]